MGPRRAGFDVFKGMNITSPKVRALSRAADGCWNAIQKMDLAEFGRQFRAAFEAQVALFPAMSNPAIQKMIREHAKNSLGWKLSGAGGGGYLVLVSATPVAGALQLKIRRKNG